MISKTTEETEMSLPRGESGETALNLSRGIESSGMTKSVSLR